MDFNTELHFHDFAENVILHQHPSLDDGNLDVDPHVYLNIASVGPVMIAPPSTALLALSLPSKPSDMKSMFNGQKNKSGCNDLHVRAQDTKWNMLHRRTDRVPGNSKLYISFVFVSCNNLKILSNATKLRRRRQSQPRRRSPRYHQPAAETLTIFAPILIDKVNKSRLHIHRLTPAAKPSEA